MVEFSLAFLLFIWWNRQVVERMSTKDARVYHKDVHNVCLAACHKISKTWSDGRDAIVECVVTVRDDGSP